MNRNKKEGYRLDNKCKPMLKTQSKSQPSNKRDRFIRRHQPWWSSKTMKSKFRIWWPMTNNNNKRLRMKKKWRKSRMFKYSNTPIKMPRMITMRWICLTSTTMTTLIIPLSKRVSRAMMARSRGPISMERRRSYSAMESGGRHSQMDTPLCTSTTVTSNRHSPIRR